MRDQEQPLTTVQRWRFHIIENHPRWATQLTPANVFAFICVTIGMVLLEPQRDLGIWVYAAFGATLAVVIVITARDIYVHREALKLSADSVQFTVAIHNEKFSRWLWAYGERRLSHHLDNERTATEIDEDRRYWVAATYVRYQLCGSKPNALVAPVLRGALKLWLPMWAAVMPFKLATCKQPSAKP